MALQISLRLQHFLTSPKEGCISVFPSAFAGAIIVFKPTQMSCSSVSSSRFNNSTIPSLKFSNLSLVEGNCRRRTGLRASKIEEEVGSDGGQKDKEDKFRDQDDEDEPILMDEEERRE
ncbi:uncharacterized protein LOC122640639 [Telopea speciosissima]|uniref:uncharacterized protein LOC122640639 n=1 Tax=Telopea speciosissima TaxID=54955 RepID=UPI001CC3C339|nr:uncharacterized protein LOC122640639 [Telopea speciosissima]XP_043689790.1 uncharacterized protein LOC122640639 [Telopea speciosissima]XP_043689791.1 uncharacterized protein LOC122640639 [Telopea speciosissima]